MKNSHFCLTYKTLKKPDFQIRDYCKEDFEKVNNLWIVTGMGGSERDDDNERIQTTISAGGKLLILEHIITREIVGTSWLTLDSRRIYLHHFGVKPAFQRKGLSEILLRESLVFAKEKGMQIKLEVHNSNVKAKAMYKKGGFQCLGNYGVYIIRNIDVF